MNLESGGYEEDEYDPGNFFSDPEHPLPAGLKHLTPPLKAFIDFFEAAPFLVSAVGELGLSLPSAQQVDSLTLISLLTRQVTNGEPGAKNEFRYRLNQLGPREKAKFSNEYDFGNSWEHIILVKKPAS
jgi:hypothetical protein